MSFLHPWALMVGAAALSLPILVHWLARPRPVRLPLSTLRFVREAVHQRRAIHRLRDAIILSLRVLALAFLAWAFSRPLWGDRAGWTAEGAGSVSRVVLLDVSQSMEANTGGVTAFERARSVAAEHLSYRSGLRGNLVFAGAVPRPAFDRYSSNFDALRQELAKSHPRPERLDVRAALATAGELLAHAPAGKEGRRELVIVTDLQRGNWTAADFSVLPEDTVIRLESVAAEQVPGNFAIVRAGASGRAEQGQTIALEVEVGNYSPTPREVEVDVTVGDATYRLGGMCPAGVSATFTRDVAVRDAGWQAGEARLVGIEDAMAADNVRSFVLDVRPRASYVLITREDPQRRPSSSYYLERALVPFLPREGRAMETVSRFAPNQVTRETLASADLIVIDRPGKLDQDTTTLLAALMRRGRSILYATAEAIDATNLKLIADAAGSDLQMPTEFVPPASGQPRRGLFLVEVRRGSAPFRVFGDEVSAAIEPLRFTRGLDSRQRENGLLDDVMAAYSDRTACLVVSACGAGSLAVFNIDLADSTLPQSPAFVPMVGELAGYLLGQRKAAASFACGEPVAVYLPPDAGVAAQLRLVGPETQVNDLGELVEESTGVLWRWPAAGEPGVYRAMAGNRPVLALATSIPAEESDLRSLERTVVTDRLAGGRKVHYRSAIVGQDVHDDLWTTLAVACVVFMLVELAALRMFRT